MKPERIKRARTIAKAMTIVWDSLETHLLIPGIEDNGTNKTWNENNPKYLKFQEDCVKEYIELLRLLSELY